MKGKHQYKSLIVILLLVTVFSAQAQKLAIGPRLGYNASFQHLTSDGADMQNQYDKENSLNTGFHAGLVLNYTISRQVSFQPELLFNQKGGARTYETKLTKAADGTDGTIKTTITDTWNYLELPAFLKITLPCDKVSFFTNGGFSAGYLFSGIRKYKADLSGEVAEYRNEDDYTFKKNLMLTEYNRFTVDLGIGAGICFITEGSHVMVEARYFHGVSEWLKNNHVNSLKSRYFSITGSCLFNLR